VQTLPVDLAANARSLGAHVIECTTHADFVAAFEKVRTTDRTSVIYIQDDRYLGIPDYEGWWDVPVAEVSEMPSVQAARAKWATMRPQERYFLEQ
jgi:3D-(3,5/4)-trihydroxycyclohexane-1,2-dione acylhydrolase (decyclizing)